MIMIFRKGDNLYLRLAEKKLRYLDDQVVIFEEREYLVQYSGAAIFRS